jgi:hypothetical protein
VPAAYLEKYFTARMMHEKNNQVCRFWKEMDTGICIDTTAGKSICL